MLKEVDFNTACTIVSGVHISPMLAYIGSADSYTLFNWDDGAIVLFSENKAIGCAGLKVADKDGMYYQIFFQNVQEEIIDYVVDKFDNDWGHEEKAEFIIHYFLM